MTKLAHLALLSQTRENAVVKKVGDHLMLPFVLWLVAAIVPSSGAVGKYPAIQSESCTSACGPKREYPKSNGDGRQSRQLLDEAEILPLHGCEADSTTGTKVL